MPNNHILLGVNIDHVATLREARGTRYPDPIQAAITAEHAGADGITLHLREDRRHIQERDVEMLSDILLTRMNLEMAVTDEMLAIAAKLQPQESCLVPEKREELTTEGGLDVKSQMPRIKDAVQQLVAANVRVSLFIDTEHAQIDAAKEVGAPVIEIHTGHYADAPNAELQRIEYEKIKTAVEYANSLGLYVNAGHGLNYQNVIPIAALPAIRELNIGHAIIANAVFSGLHESVREMKRLMFSARVL